MKLYRRAAFAALTLTVVLAALGALMLAPSATAQDIIFTVTPTPDETATPTTTPVVNMSQVMSINPKPAELPIITDALSIDPTGLHGYVITDFAPVYVREGASVVYRPLAIAQGGVFFDVTGVDEQQTWWRVRTASGQFEGWINAELLILRGDLTDVPVIPESEMGALLPITFVTFVPQPLRTEPGDAFSTIICNALPGEYVILGRDEAGTSFQIAAFCEDGTPTLGFVSAEAGALRNPYSSAVPITGAVFLPNEDNLSNVPGASLLLFQQQTIYESTDIRPRNALCDVAPNRYPIVGRDGATEFYLINAVCLDGVALTGWISADAGAFQTDGVVQVPIAATPMPEVRSVPPREPRLLTFVPQQLTQTPDGFPICEVVPGEQQILARTADGSHFQVAALCADGVVLIGWLPAEAGAFRNPFESVIPVLE